MGAFIRSHDWRGSALGSPEEWPQALRTAVRLLLNTGHPMYIFWGAEGTCLYNDAYSQSIGPERHPGSLGQPARIVWEEIWDVIHPQIEQVMRGGGATWHEDQLVPITRGGRREDVYWTYSYSPIDDDATPNRVGGVLVVCTETTKQIEMREALAAQAARQSRLFEAAPGFIAILRGPDHIFEFVNEAYVRLVGNRKFIGNSVRTAIPEVEGQGSLERLDSVFATGKPYVNEQMPFSIEHSSGAVSRHYLDFIYQPIHDENHIVTGIFVQGHDVTERYDLAEELLAINAGLEARVAEREFALEHAHEALRQSHKLDAMGLLTGGRRA